MDDEEAARIDGSGRVPPMNRKLQAEKQAQPAGIRVWKFWLRISAPGLVADAALPPGERSQISSPWKVCEGGGEARDEIVVDHSLGEQHRPLAWPLHHREGHLPVGRPVRVERAGRIVGVHPRAALRLGGGAGEHRREGERAAARLRNRAAA